MNFNLSIILITFLSIYSIWQLPDELRCREAYRLRYIEDAESLVDYTRWEKYVSQSKGLQLWHPKTYAVTETPTEIRVAKPGFDQNLVIVRLIKQSESVDCTYDRHFDEYDQDGKRIKKPNVYRVYSKETVRDQ